MTDDKPTPPTGGDTPESDEFEAAFGEYSGNDQPSEQDRDDPPAEPDAAQPEDPEAGAGQDAPDPQEPAAKAGSETPPQDSQPSAQEPSAEDIWANATPEQRAAYQAAQDQLRRLDHADRSNRGRISALTRQIDQLSRQMTDDHAERQRPSQGGKSGQSQDAAPDVFESEDWKKLQEEYPEVLGPVAKAIQAERAERERIQQKLANFDQKFQGLDQAHQQAFIAGQEQQLAERHPDWQQVTGSDAFLRWYEQAPQAVRSAIEENGEGIVNAENAAFALDLFKQAQGQQAQTQNPPSGQQTGGSDRTRSRRQRQLSAAPSVQGKGPGAASGAPDDFEAAFDHYAAK